MLDSKIVERKTAKQQMAMCELQAPTETEKSQIVEIFSQTYLRYPLTPDQLKCFMDDPNIKIVTVKENGTIAAVGFLEIENENYASITGLCCLPNYRGKGFGKKINEILIDLARKNNIKYIQSDPVLNHERAIGGGNMPNIANLCITLKNGYGITGFCLGQYVDLSHENPIQSTSVVRTVKCLSNLDSEKERFQNEMQIQRNELLVYLKSGKFTGISNFRINNPEVKISTSDNGRVLMFETSNLENFDNTGIVPCYFLPFYRNGQTSFFGIKPNLIHTRSSNEQNIFGLDKEGMRKILTKSEMEFLELIEQNMLNFPTQLSFPFIRELNI